MNLKKEKLKLKKEVKVRFDSTAFSWLFTKKPYINWFTLISVNRWVVFNSFSYFDLIFFIKVPSNGKIKS